MELFGISCVYKWERGMRSMKKKLAICTAAVLLCAGMLLYLWIHPVKRQMDFEQAIRIVRENDELSWWDFRAYESVDIGSGLKILRFDMDGDYELWVGGGEDVMYAQLVSKMNSRSRIDLQTEDLDTFLNWDHRIGRFRYDRDKAQYDVEAPGVNPYPFRNTEPSPVADYDSALQRAAQECTIAYDRAEVYYDPEADMWMVLFCEESEEGLIVLGGGQSVYVDGEGITHMIVYGE